ncbi:MAG: polysaccharide biosynthesis C-terminal domain-containing protein, partial [Rhodospirillaceae bacterium]
YLVAEKDVGLYVAASRVSVMSVVLPNLIHSAFLPALSKAKGDDVAALAAARNHARAVGFFGGAIGGVGMLLAPAIIQVLFGPAYAGAEWSLIILMAHVMMFHLTQAYGTPLLAWQCDKPYTVILAVGAFVNIALNFLLIPSYGIVGAAAATLVTQALIWLGLIALARKAFDINHNGLMLRILLVTAVAVTAVWGMAKLVPSVTMAGAWAVLVAGGALYALIYGALAIASGVISPAELRHLLNRSEANG